jgi:hypothetical protein
MMPKMMLSASGWVFSLLIASSSLLCAQHASAQTCTIPSTCPTYDELDMAYPDGSNVSVVVPTTIPSITRTAILQGITNLNTKLAAAGVNVTYTPVTSAPASGPTSRIAVDSTLTMAPRATAPWKRSDVPIARARIPLSKVPIRRSTLGRRRAAARVSISRIRLREGCGAMQAGLRPEGMITEVLTER